MSIYLPAHFRARTVSDKACITLSCGNNQKSGDGVHSISQALPPLKDPIDGDSHTLRQRCFSARVYVNKVDGAGASRGENAKIIALGEQRIEGPERVRPRIVAALSVRVFLVPSPRGTPAGISTMKHFGNSEPSVPQT